MKGVPSSLPQSFRVTDQTDPYATDDVHEDDEISDRKFASRILIASLLIGITCGSALAWRWSSGFGAIIQAASTKTVGAAVDKPAWQGDLAALRQELTQSAQASQQLLAAQQAEIDRLSGVVVPLLLKLEPIPGQLASVDKQGWQGDLAALRQELTQSAQASQQLQAAREAEIRRLSDQVVALSSKLELLHPTSAQAAMPEPTPGAAGALAPAAARKSATPLPKKRPEAPKPIAAEPADTKPAGGPITIGGLPLQLSR
jgi:hypothetical protein